MDAVAEEVVKEATKVKECDSENCIKEGHWTIVDGAFGIVVTDVVDHIEEDQEQQDELGVYHLDRG